MKATVTHPPPSNDLLNDIRNCTLCADHLPLGPKPLLQASPTASILIAAQAPGRITHIHGRPFHDKSGDRLRSWLGLDWETFYDPTKIAIIAAGFCYPGTGKSGDLPPRPECAPKWHPPLLAMMPNIKLNLIIGQYSIGLHMADTKHKNLTETVRNWATFWPDLLPLPHPSPRNNVWFKRNPWFEAETLPALKERVSQLLDQP